MCPACIGTAAWIVAGAASTGGLAALVAHRFGSKQPNEDNGDHGGEPSAMTKQGTGTRKAWLLVASNNRQRIISPRSTS